MTHRLAYEMCIAPIPRGLHVLHRCDNPPCCNPDHLFLGTIADNNADKVAKGRQMRGTMTPRAVLTESQVSDIRARYAAGERVMDLAVEFGVSRAQISNIAARRIWRHVA